jgi:spore germination cell wall hydrolase CwlJ-like protein
MWLFAIPAAIFGAAFFTRGNAQGQSFISKVKEMFGPPEPYGPRQTVNASDLDVMARTIWGEARGEGRLGMQAVANVIMNRYALVQRNKAYGVLWGRTIKQICQKPSQFSVWLTKDRNYVPMTTVTASDPLFAEALSIARMALSYTLADITKGATFYHTKQIRPTWVVKSGSPAPIKIVGNHMFYTAGQIA